MSSTFFHTFLINSEVNVISKSLDKKQENLVNEDITAEVVLVISETGEKLGELNRLEALKIADEHGYDLVCVAPNAPVPVCKETQLRFSSLTEGAVFICQISEIRSIRRSASRRNSFAYASCTKNSMKALSAENVSIPFTHGS